MPLVLHAILPYDAHGAPPLPLTGDGPTLVPLRELAAVVTPKAQFAADTPTPEEIAAHRAVVDKLFRQTPTVPAPVGTVFRSGDALARWMELHYVPLGDALGFVADRRAARLPIHHADVRSHSDAGGTL